MMMKDISFRNYWCLIGILLLGIQGISIGQKRITDIVDVEKTYTVTFLTSFQGDNYVCTITPDDTTRFYRVRSDQSFERIRVKYIPDSYATRQGNKVFKEKHFLIISDVEIHNYDFINNTTQITKINNPLPENNSFSVNDTEQDEIRFKLNKTSYLYDYKSNRVDSFKFDIFRRLGDHLIISDGVNFFYSNDKGKNQTKLISRASNINTSVFLYQDHILMTDGQGHIIKYSFTGQRDTILTMELKPKTSYFCAFETQDYLIASVSIQQDSTTLQIYEKNTLKLLYTPKLSSSHEIFVQNRVMQIQNAVVIRSSRPLLGIFHPYTQKGYINTKVVLNNQEGQLFNNGSKLLFYSLENQNYFLKTIDVNTFRIDELLKSKEHIFYYANESEWFKNGTTYFYNRPGNIYTKNITLFSLDQDFSNFKKVPIDTYLVGLKDTDPLVNINGQMVLFSVDLYAIQENGYTKINKNPLSPLLTRGSQKYRIMDEGVLFAESDGPFKKVYFYDGNTTKFISIFINETTVKDIIVLGDFALFVSVYNKLNLIDIKSQSKIVVADVNDRSFGLPLLYTDGVYCYFMENQSISIFDVKDQSKTILTQGEFYYEKPLIKFKGKTFFLSGSSLKVVNDDKTVSDVSEAESSISNYLVVDDQYIYMRAFKSIESVLLEYDGTETKLIDKGDQIDLSSYSNGILVYQRRANVSAPLSTWAYDNTSNKKYRLKVKKDEQINRVYPFKDSYLGAFQSGDSVFLVQYTFDFKNYKVLNKWFTPFVVDQNIIGVLPQDRLLISTGSSLVYVDEKLKMTVFEELEPNEMFQDIFIQDSVYYFIAKGRPYGNQVYSFNHLDFSGTVSTESIVFSGDNLGEIYPNPAHDEIYLKLGALNKVQSVTYHISDALGILVTSGTVSEQNAIDIKNLKPGVYHLMIENGHKPLTISFIKI